MNREELEQLPIEELVTYANRNFGLGVTKDYNPHDILNQVDQAQRKFKGNALMRVLEEGDEDAEVGPGMMKIRIRPGKYDRIPRPVIIGHQFKIASVPVNRDVIMPARYLVCFEDAVQDVYFTDETTKEWICQQEHAYPYSVLEMGPKVRRAARAIKPAMVKRPIAEPDVAESPEVVETGPSQADINAAMLQALTGLGAQMQEMNATLADIKKPAPKTTKKKATRKKAAAKKA